MRFSLLTIPLLVGLVGACSSDGNAPVPRVARVTVTSARDSILAVGRSSPFTATAYDAADRTIPAVFAWLSSHPGVAEVEATGRVSGVAPGPATIHATMAAETGVAGSLAIRVVDADLETVATLSADPFGAALRAVLSPGARPPAETAWDLCATHADDGNIVAIRRCITELRAQTAAAAEGTDRALFASLVLFADEMERRLAL